MTEPHSADPSAAADPGREPDDDPARTAVRKAVIRLVPFLGLLYFVNYCLIAAAAGILVLLRNRRAPEAADC